MATFGQPRHPRDARQVGVPVVRRVGLAPSIASFSRMSTRRRRSISSSCCFASGTCTQTGNLPAYEWNFSDVQSAGSGVGGVDDLRYRRPRRLQFSGARIPEAPDQFHLVGQPQRRRWRQHIRRRIPWPRQHRTVRSHRKCCLAARFSSNPTRRPGWRNIASTCWRSRWSSPITIPHTRTSRSNSSSTSGRSPRRWTSFGTRRMAFSMIVCRDRMGR